MIRCPSPPRLPPAAARLVPGKVSIVVLNWNAAPFLQRALSSIVRHTHRPYELVIVDNGSTDGSKDVIRRFIVAHTAIHTRYLDEAENHYFSKGFNLGFQAAARDAEYITVFCNDVEVKDDGWLDGPIAALQAPRVIAAGHAEPGYRLPAEHREVFRRNAPQYADAILDRRMRRFVADPDATYTHLYGYCFLLRRSLLEHAGLYLEGGEFKQYHSDWEWYVRFRMLGYDIAAAPPTVHHWHSVSELIALYPHLYRDLLGKIADPETADRFVNEGRPLYPEESGYRELERQRRLQGRNDGR
jgi:GT2 family glycosyltransferase